ncbi:MAG: PQQ-binding-like beta-propeller repeat protein [Candidatus Eisenbacteria sp.]|nr:PQQ-binding-like beta-propeller repeat protein [Candidatus Eisenbacteria bacterium]
MGSTSRPLAAGSEGAVLSAAGRSPGGGRTPGRRLLFLLLMLLPALAGHSPGPAAAAPEPAVGGSAGVLRLQWRTDLGRALGGGLDVSAEAIVATTLDRHCMLLDRETGRRCWDRQLGAGIQAGATLAGGVVVGVTDHPAEQLFCLDARTGATRWEVPLGESWGAPLVAGDWVYAGSLAGEVRAVALADGRLHWSYRAPATVRAPLALIDSLLLVSTAGDSLIALDASEGTFVWGIGPGGALYGAPQWDGEQLWCVTHQGRVCALDLATGAVIAERTLPGTYRCGLACGELLFALSAAGRLTALERSSLDVRWTEDFAAAADLTPTVAAGWVWVGLRDGSVRALRETDGWQIFDLAVPPPVAAPIRVVGEQVLIGSGRGVLVAYQWPAAGPEERGSGEGTERGVLPEDCGAARGGLAVRPGASRFPAAPVSAASWMLPRVAAARGGGGTLSPAVLASLGIGSPALARSADAQDRGGRGGTIGRWLFPIGWVLGAGAALWLQAEADNEYDRYRTTGNPGGRERAFDRAEVLDRAVIGAWVVSEVCFLLGVRAWLRHADPVEQP